MKLPSVEFMMIAARGIALLMALATLAWAIVRWRRDTTRDAQRVFEQLDLVRAELLQLQGQMHSAPQAASSAIAQYQHHQPVAQPARHASSTSVQRSSAYSDSEQDRKAIMASRPASEAIRPKNLTNAAPRGYEVASRLARSGATVEELVNTCALSRNEAELMVRLHAGMKSSQPPGTKQDAHNNAASGSSSRAHANLNQLKNIGTRANAAPAKPVAQNVNRPAPIARPVTHQRVSLVG